MKKVLAIIAICLMIGGCGSIEQMYEEANYESLTNEKGEVHFYSGGKLIEIHKNAKIIYSDSNSFAMWIKTETGSSIYWQGEAKIILR